MVTQEEYQQALQVVLTFQQQQLPSLLDTDLVYLELSNGLFNSLRGFMATRQLKTATLRALLEAGLTQQSFMALQGVGSTRLRELSAVVAQAGVELP